VLLSRPPTLSILDPTSLLGRELIDRVAVELPEVHRRLFHTDDDAEHLAVEVAGEPALVSPLSDLEELDGSSVVVVTHPLGPGRSERLLGWLRTQPEVRLLDCSQPGLAGAEAASVIGALPAGPHGRPWFHLADPALIGPSRVIAALAPLAPAVCHLTIVVPASAYGVEGVDELVAQSAARLSGRTPKPAAHLPTVLAFDLAASHEDRLSGLDAQIAELFPSLEIHLRLADAGVFHGYLASVAVSCRHEASAQDVRALLRAGDALRLVHRNVRFRVSDAAQTDGIMVGGVRSYRGWVSAWLAYDGLRVGGADVAVAALLGLLAS